MLNALAAVEGVEEAVETVAANDPSGLLNIFGVPIIFCLVFALMTIYKHLVKDKNSMWTSLIPVFAGLCGIVLEIWFFYTFPQLVMVDDVVSAIIVGFTTGLSAVGVHQIGKQLSKDGSTNVNENLYNLFTGNNTDKTNSEKQEEKKATEAAPAKTLTTTQSVKVPEQTITLPSETIQVRQSYTKVE